MKQPIGQQPTNTAWCSGCQANHPVDRFGKSRERPSGLQRWCYEHQKKYYREWTAKNKPAKMVADAKQRAKLKGLPFDIEASDITIPEKCPVLGIKLVSGKGKQQDSSPTLERLKPELGYVKGNVIVVSAKANRMRNSGSAAELLRAGCWYAQHHPEV